MALVIAVAAVGIATAALTAAVPSADAGADVDISALRGGQSKTIKVKL
jgi:hypothetical protein